MPTNDLAHSLVVIGGSAGALTALKQICSGLAADFPGSVLVVIHSSRTTKNYLPEILDGTCPLSAVQATHGMRIEKKRIYVAPPDFHLLVEDAHLHLWYGPQENMQRPSINVTFRSAVDSNPKNIVGVLLSGLLDDGCMGLWYVKEHGGTVIVQDPKDARYSDMPGNALKSVNVDYCVTAAEIGPLVSELVRNHNDAPARKEVEMESANALAVTCPACHGPISEFKRGPNREYRCLVGHSYGTHEILHAHHESEESALWRAKGHLEESAQLLERGAETLPEEDLRVMNDYTKRKLELAQKIGELLAQLGPFPFPTV